MALILNIDTATEKAGICLADGDHVLGILSNQEQKDHAAWLHLAIAQLLENADYTMKDLQAIALTSGPGSYTGLRVGMAAAKGYCFALGIPLITETSLRTMALAAIQQLPTDTVYLVCPMLDARRLEVYTAIYSNDLKEIKPPAAEILTPDSYAEWLEKGPVYFLGSGIEKWKTLTNHPHARFMATPFLASHLALLAHEKYSHGQFSSLSLTEPVYLKEFFTHEKK